MSLLGRLMRQSVSRATKMQPKWVDRAVNEHLYAAPSARDEVAAIAEAAARLDRLGFAPAGLAAIAVRRSAGRATVTAAGCDLGSVDNRHLESVAVEAGAEANRAVLAGLLAGHNAAVWAYPPKLLCHGTAGRLTDAVNVDLAAVAGAIGFGDDPAELTGRGETVWVVRRRGVLAVGSSASEAVRRVEAAEALALLASLQAGDRKCSEGANSE